MKRTLSKKFVRLKKSKIKTRKNTKRKSKKKPKLSKKKTSRKKKLTKKGGAAAMIFSDKVSNRNNFFLIQSNDTPNAWVEPTDSETIALCKLIEHLNDAGHKKPELINLATRGIGGVKVFCYGVDYQHTMSNYGTIIPKLTPISPVIIYSNSKYKYVIFSYHHEQGQDDPSGLKLFSITSPDNNSKPDDSVSKNEIYFDHVKNSTSLGGGGGAGAGAGAGAGPPGINATGEASIGTGAGAPPVGPPGINATGTATIG